MVRSAITAGAMALALSLVMFAGSAMRGPVSAAAPTDSNRTGNSTAQPGQLVTQEELCAFRAPLLLEADTVPITCLPVVEWLRRVINADMECGDIWLQRGAIPECALPYR
ncbi:MAG: hypothetical protein AB7R89_28585 [Dehalococcoidia bacterium]